MPTKDEKIVALLTGRATEMIADSLGDKATSDSYNDFFDIQRIDIDEVVKINGVPRESYKLRYSLKDGYYLIPQDGKWCVYSQERNIVFAQKEFKKKKRLLIIS